MIEIPNNIVISCKTQEEWNDLIDILMNTVETNLEKDFENHFKDYDGDICLHMRKYDSDEYICTYCNLYYFKNNDYRITSYAKFMKNYYKPIDFNEVV